MEALLMELTASMGLSSQTAFKAIDLAMAGASGWAIAATIIAGGGVVGIGTAVLSYYIRRKVVELGTASVVAW